MSAQQGIRGCEFVWMDFTNMSVYFVNPPGYPCGRIRLPEPGLPRDPGKEALQELQP